MKIIKSWVDLDKAVREDVPEDVVNMWDLDYFAMLNDKDFRTEVIQDSEGLIEAIKMLQHNIDGMTEAYGKVFSDYLKHKHYPEAIYYIIDMSDPRYPCNPSRAAALRIILDYLIKLLEGWHTYKIPEEKEKEVKTEPTVAHELQKLNKMNTVQRVSYLQDHPDLTEIWLVNKLEKRRQEETEHLKQEKEEAIQRFKRSQRLKTEKLSENEQAHKNLRDLLAVWVKDKQSSTE
jgi:hypothetical protein